MNVTAASSRSSSPRSRSCMIAVPVNVLVIEAILYRVVASGARFAATSANPIPAHHTSASPCTIPTEAPATRCCLTNAAAFASSCAATSTTGLPIRAPFDPGQPYRQPVSGSLEVRAEAP